MKPSILPVKSANSKNCDIYKRRQIPITEMTKKDTKPHLSIKNVLKKKDLELEDIVRMRTVHKMRGEGA